MSIDNEEIPMRIRQPQRGIQSNHDEKWNRTSRNPFPGPLPLDSQENTQRNHGGPPFLGEHCDKERSQRERGPQAAVTSKGTVPELKEEDTKQSHKSVVDCANPHHGFLMALIH